MPNGDREGVVEEIDELMRIAELEAKIFDYVDHAVPMLARMFAKRLRGYRSIGYARGEAPLGYAEPKELTIEYDADADLGEEE